jgi:hypothetical protein
MCVFSRWWYCRLLITWDLPAAVLIFGCTRVLSGKDRIATGQSCNYKALSTASPNFAWAAANLATGTLGPEQDT